MSEYMRVKIRGYHLDQHGHLDHGGYMMFLEEARWSLFESYNSVEFFSQLKLALTIVNSNIDFHRPCISGDRLEIQTKVTKIGRSSCIVKQSIYCENDNKLVAEATNTFVLMDKSTRTAVPIEGKTRDKLEQLTELF